VEGRNAHELHGLRCAHELRIGSAQWAPRCALQFGIAYSTGQGVGVDYVAAHKWFKSGGHVMRRVRGKLSREMSAVQIAEAQRQAASGIEALEHFPI